MSKVILYSTGCPSCNVLQKKLTAKGIQFEEKPDQALMRSMKPVLDVDGKQMDFAAANNWINEQENVQ